MKNKSKNTTLSEIVQNIIENTTLSEIVQNIIEKYHTVGNSSKYNSFELFPTVWYFSIIF
jgi:hypothetical protein